MQCFRAAAAAIFLFFLGLAGTGWPLLPCADDPADPLKTMQAELAQLKQTLADQQRQIDHAFHAAGHQDSHESRPSIGAVIDASYAYFDGSPANTDRAAGSDFALRGAELILRADVDPYFKACLVLAAAADTANNDEASLAVEEAFFYTTALPVVQIKGGRFFVPVGRLSPVHNHELPFTTRPPSLETYVGGESGGDGVMLQTLLTKTWFVQLSAGVFNKIGSEFPLLTLPGAARRGAELTYFAKAFAVHPIGNDHNIAAGFSAVQTPDHDIHRDLIAIEFTWTWHPVGQPRPRLVWGSELLRNTLQTDTGAGLVQRTGWGGYSYVEFFFNQQLSLGPRVDVFENVDPTLDVRARLEKTKTWTGFITYAFSEFSRLRLQFDRQEFPDGTHASVIFFQATMLFGDHLHDSEEH